MSWALRRRITGDGNPFATEAPALGCARLGAPFGRRQAGKIPRLARLPGSIGRHVRRRVPCLRTNGWV